MVTLLAKIMGVETIGTKYAFTRAAHCRAFRTKLAVAVTTALQAGLAGGRVAVGAAGTAVVTHLGLADIAIAAVTGDMCSTGVTIGAVPVAERGIRTVTVIGVQHLVDDLKEIGQSAGAQGLPHGTGGISFTQAVAHHMRMRDVGLAVRTTGTDGLN